MLPQDFKKEMLEQLGTSDAEALFAALEETPPVSVRMNRAKTDGTLDLSVESPVAWCDDAYYLTHRPQFTLDPLFHAGCYYVQEASSMAVAEVWKMMNLTGSQRILDLCAAPGGKSTLWASLLSAEKDSLLVSNEPIHNRRVILAENMAKWGLTNVVVTQKYPIDFAPYAHFFDVVAADVPCSGEGMFRKDEGARTEWSLQNVAICAERQYNIIKDVWPSLRPSGYLVYSTCTFNRAENEDNVERICQTLGAELLHSKHFYPHLSRGEGFFVALLRKNGEEEAIASRQGSTRVGKRKAQNAGFSPLADKSQGRKLMAWLKEADDFHLMMSPKNDAVYAFRKYDESDSFTTARVHDFTLVPRLKIATKKGDKWIPTPELALSTSLAEDAFPRAELPLDDALAYLHREAITLPSEAPRGYVLVTYKAHPLGFVNNLGTRANNLYPPEWKIRKV